MTSNDLELTILTDADLIKISKNRRVYNNKDLNLEAGSRSNQSLIPVPGGLYDGKIFGSLFETRCNCNTVRVPGVLCELCGTMALSPIERISRYAYYDLEYYYVTPIKLDGLVEYLSKFVQFYSIRNKYEMLYLSQYDWNGKHIVATDEITDYSKVGLEYLLQLIKDNLPEKESGFYKYANKLIPIIPAYLRKVKYFTINGKRKIKLPETTAMYRAVIEAKEIVSKNLNKELTEKDVLMIANLRLLASNALMKLSGFYKSSKATYLRSSSYQSRMTKSGRAVIVGDPNLRLDQIGLPTFMCYEMMKKDFLLFMRDQMLIPDNEVESRYNNPDDELMEKFKAFASNKVVLLNRPPTLTRYSIQAFRVVCFDDYVIHVPNDVTTSFNADYDGDALMTYLVPDHLADYVMKNASAIVSDNYAHNNQPIYKPKHEVLLWLSLASKMLPPESDPMSAFVTEDDMEDAYNNGDIYVNESIQLGSTITTYGRWKLAKIFKISNLSDYIGDDYLKAKNIKVIYDILNQYDGDERLSIIQAMDKFVMDVVTEEGATSLPLKEIYRDIPTEYRDRIIGIMESDLPHADKVRESELIYNEMLDSVMKSYDDKFIEYANDTDRVKLGALVSMVTPQFSIDAKNQVHFTSNSLVEGLSEEDMIHHAASNREMLKMKAKGTPLSGFLDRQGVETARKLICIKDLRDDNNSGIQIPMKDAVGRVLLDGSVVGPNNSDELVTVRSILGSSTGVYSTDLINQSINISFNTQGRASIGIDYLTQLFQAITQSMLSLKHGGVMRFVEESNKLYAPVDGEVEITENRIKVHGNKTEYILPTSFSTRGSGYYKKGELIGQVPKYVTASIRLESILAFLKAQGTLGDGDMANKIDKCRCYTMSKSRTVTVTESGRGKVGNVVVPADKLLLYPIGAEVPPFTRFCSGVPDMRDADNLSMQSRFNLFRSFMLSQVNVDSTILEMLLYTIGKTKYHGILATNTTQNQSALSAIAYGYAKKSLKRVVAGELKINEDPYTEINISAVMFKLIDNLND